MNNAIRYIVLALVLLALSACSQPSGGGSSNDEVQISGELEVVGIPAGTSAAALNTSGFSSQDKGIDLNLDIIEMGTAADKPRLVPGELIVKFKGATLSPQAVKDTLLVGELELKTRSLLAADAHLFEVSGATLNEAETLALAETLSARPDIAYAVPNQIEYAQVIPDDTNYALQWHYPAIRLPEAWDIIRESSATVAVVDSGIFYAEGVPSANHPDLEGVILPGFDFVSDLRSAGDNDGYDPVAYDMSVGTEQGGHGTHVAGTIGAASNNGRDLAGVNWRAHIVPVRVLGVDGSGTTQDIMQGALWAAGGSIPGIPNNPNPAKVINMSIGGIGPCIAWRQNVFQQIFDLGAIVVVAAGNENIDANRGSTASCPGVIVVGATDAKGDRAPYSNYGPRIDVMAPGGNIQADDNGDSIPDGVISLGAANSQFGAVLKQGTSMAAPHVAGVISLMAGINPDITAQEALTILRNTAVPLSPASCARPTGKDCGAGLINAYGAIQAVGQPSVPTASGQTLAVTPNPIDFSSSSSQVSLTLTNPTNAAISYSITDVNWYETNPAPYVTDLLAGENTNGSIPAGGSTKMTMTLDRSKIPADGQYSFDYIFNVNGQPELIFGRFSQGAATGTPTGSTLVASFLLDRDGELLEEANGDLVVGAAEIYDRFVPAYAMDAVQGNHFVVAWVDQNANAEVDDGDFIGVVDETVTVTQTAGQDNVDVTVSQSFGVASFESLSAKDKLDRHLSKLANDFR